MLCLVLKVQDLKNLDFSSISIILSRVGLEQKILMKSQILFKISIHLKKIL